MGDTTGVLEWSVGPFLRWMGNTQYYRQIRIARGERMKWAGIWSSKGQAKIMGCASQCQGAPRPSHCTILAWKFSRSLWYKTTLFCLDLGLIVPGERLQLHMYQDSEFWRIQQVNRSPGLRASLPPKAVLHLNPSVLIRISGGMGWSCVTVHWMPPVPPNKIGRAYSCFGVACSRYVLKCGWRFDKSWIEHISRGTLYKTQD
ncbi:hypothetical protein QBC37DRAFT_134379 [Rhypophila decipiens]|uniref:Uncharacterized protein n=1 Tax=Rhypophila decipiens TaxID=261697 RepID=A0AAN6YIK4_9PEZI|nr:hypothetical protein QBC37DRAFT_134379 [Rhypophila decipiens]